jgi:hypothetical protein
MALKPDLTIPVLGLNVDANPLVRQRGSLSVADNIVLRQPGKAEPAKAPVSMIGGDTPRLPNFAPDASTHGVRIFSQGDANTLAIERVTAGAADLDATKLRLSVNPTSEYSTVSIGTSTRTLSFDNQRTQHTYSDGRHLLTSEAGVLVVDGTDTSSNQVPRLAGLVSPSEIAASALTSPVISLANTYISYVAVFRRKVGSTYALYSAPSRRTIVTDTVDFGVSMTVYLAPSDPIRAGDEVLFYRTKAASSTSLIIPQYFECISHTITAGDIASYYASATDGVHDDYLDGAELYTNDGQDGPLNVNYMPPLASDVCAFANSALYLNKSSWPVATLQVSGAFGDLDTAAERTGGIGVRAFQATYSGAGANLTGVSDAHVVGLVAGQQVKRQANAAIPREIVSITHIGVNNNTVTLDAAPGGAAAVDLFTAFDRATLTFNTTGVTQRVSVYIGPNILGTSSGIDSDLRNLSLPGVRLFSDVATGDTLANDNAPSLAFVPTIPGTCDSITISSITNQGNYANGATTISSTQDTRTNLVWFSKLQQPEAVSPLANFVVGAEKILRLTKVGQAVLAWCTDGLYLVQGDAANGFVTQQLDPKCILYHPSAVAVLGSTAYALTYSGIIKAGEGGLESVSKNAVDTRIQESFGDWPETWNFAAVADPVNNEVRFSFPDGRTLVYNTLTGQWATRTDDMIHGCFDRGVDAVGRRTPDVIITTPAGYFCDSDHCAATELRHNSVSPEAPTVVSQYVDTCLMFEEDLVPTVGITFDGTVSRSVTPSATETAHELQCRVPRRAARKPRLTVGFTTAAGGGSTPTWSYSGFGCRYRASTTKVKR